MSDGLFSTVELGSTGRPGYRLHHLEVLNWGTFDKRVWRLTPGGETSLLTGDIGSGKSTLVDALTTLLLPAHRIAYNKAAGAEARERTLRSYVEGHYKTERIESTGALRAIGLRDHHTYSVVLAVFANTGHDETVTLAQVFHQKDRTGQPDRFFVTCTKELSIGADFADFGTELRDLRARLRAAGADVHTGFPEYGRQLRRMLGIHSEQAMELFHQTVSMKSVGNLNEFVRRHMLEPADASEKVRGIVAHFEDLTAAHDAVRRARDQLDALDPLVKTADRYDEAIARRTATERQRDAVRLFVASLRINLLDAAIAEAEVELTGTNAELASTTGRRADLASAREQLIADRENAGGNRVSMLEREAADARELAEARLGRRHRFDMRVQEAGLSPVTGPVEFAALAADVRERTGSLTARRDELDERINELVGDRARTRDARAETSAELDSLKGRTSNLPAAQLALRAELCAHLGLEPAELPFVGELVDVADERAEWRGAAERVLRGFALSLLVRDEHYASVAAWANSHRLTHRRRDGSIVGARLVYERIAARRVPLRREHGGRHLTLAECLDVQEGPFAAYLADELARRADHVCAESLQEFRESNRAVTREGQVRSGDRHEKDDRSRVDDPATWVLGWMNERKVDALTTRLADQDLGLAALERELQDQTNERGLITARVTALAGLREYPGWDDLDHGAATARAERADAERGRLIAASSRLIEIDQRLAENSAEVAAVEKRLTTLNEAAGALKLRLVNDRRERENDAAFVAAHPDPDGARTVFPELAARLGANAPSTAAECRTVSEDLSSSLQAQIDRIGRELGGYSQSLLEYMTRIRQRWPEATTEMDASVDALGEYRAFHARVASDDLPRFEAEFKRQLNTNAIRELAQFNNWLRRQSEDIGARVARINEALGAIDYSPGRSITLLAERTDNREIGEFRAQLRAITDDALAPDDDQYTEQRFTDVRAIIERFRGRELHADADKAWTARVTDVRNWFVFSASERDRLTDAEWEHYRDSDGKSGGQKEKLAYTILAASLAYQFGLEWGAPRSRDFRFAVIDEAFGRGSDASTRYALDLFAKLGLQLLIVTPLQKVHVIEPYVRAIGFVDNPDGSSSRLQTLTIEEYRARRDTTLR